MKKISCLLFIILIGVAIDADAKNKGRKFYLTQTQFTGSQALTACAKKFHMASLWEIFDTAALQYDTQNGLAYHDSGSGPPVAGGWVRTGGLSNNFSSTPGRANCNSWTLDTGLGSVIFLEADWDKVGFNISPWVAVSFGCNSPLSVWCVQD